MTYYLLTGKKPHGLAEIASRLVPGLDPKWDKFIKTCLAEDPANRYQTAREAGAALNQITQKSGGGKGWIAAVAALVLLAGGAGYWYSQTAVPDASFSPSVPDADQHALSIGLGFLCKGGGYLLGVVSCGTAGNGSLQPKAIGLDLAYQAILYETRTVNGNQNPLAFPSDAVDGTYRTTLHVGAINLKVTF